MLASFSSAPRSIGAWSDARLIDLSVFTSLSTAMCSVPGRPWHPCMNTQVPSPGEACWESERQHTKSPPVGWGHLGWTLTPLKFQALGEENMEKLFCLGRLGLEEKGQRSLFSDETHRGSGQMVWGRRRTTLSEALAATLTPDPSLTPRPPRGKSHSPTENSTFQPVKMKSRANPRGSQKPDPMPRICLYF